MDTVDGYLERQRDSMEAILNLKDVPDVQCDPADLEKMNTIRSIPMLEEREIVWALQDGDDTSSRQAIPEWIARHISRKVACWAECNSKWMDRINKRAEMGRDLTPSMQKSFDTWCNDTKQQKLLFSKSKQSLVTKIRANADLRKLEEDTFSLTIQMSDDPSRLCVKAGSGRTRRLVLLQGQPVDQSCLPSFLDSGVEGGADGLVVPVEDAASDPGDGNDDDMEVTGQFDEQEALEMQDQDQMSDASNADIWEIMAHSDEEDALKKQVGFFQSLCT